MRFIAGASDDAVACAVLLEIMRAFVLDNEQPLLHPVIFLFNGAEENILQASHGFITQHPWAKQVFFKYVLRKFFAAYDFFLCSDL